MKIQIGVDRGTYTFSASVRTVYINDINPTQLEQLLLITNVTSNRIIYNFGDNSLGATTSYVNGRMVINLAYDTTSMLDSDRLQIFLNYTDENTLLLRRAVKLLESNGTVDVNNLQRVSALVTQPTAAALNAAVFQGTAASLNATVFQGTASSLNATVVIPAIPVDQRYEFMDRSRIAYDTVRSRISFT